MIREPRNRPLGLWERAMNKSRLLLEERPLAPSRWGFIALCVSAVYLLTQLECGSPMLDRHLQAWHLRCDTHRGKPVDIPEALDCSRELHELIVYAKMKGLNREAEELTAYAKAAGWAR